MFFTGEGGGGGEAADRRTFVEKQLQERYKPREVRELLAKYGDNAEVALENLVSQNNDMVQRLMRRQAELEYDLLAAQQSTTSLQAQVEAVAKERDEAKASLDGIARARRQEEVDRQLKARFDDEAIARRHRAYLLVDGYTLDVDGEGDKAQLMLVKGDKRHRFETIVNDAFYERYADAKPQGDTPLPSSASSGKAERSLSQMASDYFAQNDQRAAGFLMPPTKG